MNDIVLDFTPNDRWGQWRFDSPRLCLVHEKLDYEVDLERINSCAAMLDWIFQIAGKVKEYEFENFVLALSEIFQPQAKCCSNGLEKEFLGTQISREHASKLIAHEIKPWSRQPKFMDVYYLG